MATENENIVDNKSYEDLWKETNIEETQNIVVPENENKQSDPTQVQTKEQEVQQVPVQQPQDVQTTEPVQEQTQEPVQKNISLDELDKFFNERDNKKEQERKLQEELAEKQRLELEEKKRKEEEENQSIFKDFSFDSNSVLSDDDKKEVEKIDKEFPEISKYMSIIKKQMQAEYDAKVKFLEQNTKKGLTDSYINMYDKINSEFKPTIDSLKAKQQQEYVEYVKTELTKKHADWEQISDDVGKWMDESVPQMKQSLMAMLGSGDINQMSKVFDLYKKDVGLVNKPVQQQATQQQSPAIVNKKQALMGSSSKSSLSNVNNANPGGLTYEDLWKSTEV